ncbi:MAG: hypothetical protein LBQ36_02130 [Synergistaceae bacterium]|nr:hypothetical protein [Synergistaceae bacterium]
MDVKNQLDAVERLLFDVYESDVSLGAMLEGYLSDGQLNSISTERAGEFLRMFLYGVRCRFASTAGGMRLYSVLSGNYGMEAVSVQADAPDMNSVPDASVGEAIKRLKPTDRTDVLKQIARLAAREVCGIAVLPSNPKKWRGGSAPERARLPEIDDDAIDRFAITDDAASLKEMAGRINQALGSESPESSGYVRPGIITGWLREKGFLATVATSDGKRYNQPAAPAAIIGITGEMRQGKYGEYVELMFGRRAQEFLKDNLREIVSSRTGRQRKNAAPNRGKPWLPPMDDQLKKRFSDGAALHELAREFGRTTAGIQARLKLHGLIDDAPQLFMEKAAN